LNDSFHDAAAFLLEIDLEEFAQPWRNRRIHRRESPPRGAQLVEGIARRDRSLVRIDEADSEVVRLYFPIKNRDFRIGGDGAISGTLACTSTALWESRCPTHSDPISRRLVLAGQSLDTLTASWRRPCYRNRRLQLVLLAADFDAA
jgi:hypothetical protein